MIMDNLTRFKEWVIRASFSREINDLKLEELTRPFMVGWKCTPESLDNMTIGQMIRLSDCKNGVDMFYRICDVLLDLPREAVDICWAVDVVRFCGWVLGRVKKINALFDSVKSKPTQQERMAGIDDLKFGVFGLVDWYALRMGITDHEEVMSVTWGRVYKCLEMDMKKREFEKRLIKVYDDEHRR